MKRKWGQDFKIKVVSYGGIMLKIRVYMQM